MPSVHHTVLAALLACLASTPVAASSGPAHPLAGMPLRELGPAYPSGRIADFAFHPQRKHEFYVATASGGLWRTRDNTNTWEPLFDSQASFAIGVVEIDPSTPTTVWVGTGENNAQRSVAAGDGVYRSIDGGVSWERMGLEHSGHIGRIWINPADGQHVRVAAQGPLWSDGGDRGLYETRDGGKTWKPLLQIDKYTGVNEFVVDPRNPDRIVASSWQRRRHVWTLIDGGPGSGIHRSDDGGKTWRRIERGLPKDHMGRIGLAMAPSAPDTLYAIVEALDDKEKGVYASTDFGANWSKRSDYVAGSPQYYNEIIVDPNHPERLYAMDTFAQLSEDGGKSWKPLSIEHKHVDDHALWIDPDNSEHLYIGGDGGIYESWDRGTRWRHVDNLPIVQFYRVTPDDERPFYKVCGGTQDNNSLCVPSRTTSVHGITNSHWRTILGGDGYKPQFDPNDPDIIYAQYQYGGLVRFDRRSGERTNIMPHPEADQPEPRWNWNTPLLVSPHNGRRLYYAAEYLYRSDDRGDSWQRISPDLSRQLDRNRLKVMGRVWSVDAVAKNDSTSRYGSIIGLSESPLIEGLLYVGTDDGLISVSEDGGKTWHTEDAFRGVPDMAYVDDLVASVHDPDVAYAVIDNHKRGDFKPYVLRTSDRGRSWRKISGNLPERGFAHTIAEDHVDPKLLFLGTEYGLYFTQDGGLHWHKFQGLPTISVRDLEIQRRANDLVIGTFGRGLWILDDYRALRTPAKALGSSPATLFPVPDAWIYVQDDFFDRRERGSRGAGFWRAENPPFGAVFSYYLKDAVQPERKQRRAQEVAIEEKGGDTPYPSWDTLRAEDREEEPAVLLIVRDADGQIVRRVPGETTAGFHRVAWDLRWPAPDPIDLNPNPNPPYWESPPMGPLALPGTYSVELAVRRQGKLQTLAGPQRFQSRVLPRSPEITDDRRALLAFQQRAAELYRAVSGMAKLLTQIDTRVKELREALRRTPADIEPLRAQLDAVAASLANLDQRLNGDATISSRNESVPWSIAQRVSWVYAGHLESQAPIPATLQGSLEIAEQQYDALHDELQRTLAALQQLETEAEARGAPWTHGRVPSPIR